MLKTYLCFDLGTTKIKSAMIDEKGKIIYISSIIAKSYIEVEAVIQKPEEYYQNVVSEIKKMKKKFPSQFKNTDSIICSGQMAGVMSIDANWEVVLPWTYSVDSRANKYLYEIEESLSAKIRKSSGGIPFMASRIKWIMKEFPTDYEKTAKFINLTTYVAGKLCKLASEDAFIDYSILAMSGFAEVEKGIWNREICDILGIDLKKLPSIKRPYEVVGHINKGVFDTANDLRVLVGIGDQIAGFIGAGIIQKHDLVDVAGTYTVIGYCTDKFIPDFKEKIISSINSGIEGLYYQIAVVAVGGYLHNWFLKNFNYKCSKKFKDIIKTDGLFFMPHIGGRSAPSQPYYQGTWYGIKWHHNLDSFYISMLESLGYEYYMLLQKIRKNNRLKDDVVNSIRVIGGGSKDIIWNKIKSSIMDIHYEVMEEIPFEILGGFLIARYGNNLREGVQDLIKNKIINIKEVVRPDQEDIVYYNSLKIKYARIVESIGKVYMDLS